MSHVHKSTNYMAIFWWLAGLTVVEVGYSSILPHEHKAALIIGLVGFAAIKASLVALYFMHYNFRRIQKSLRATPACLDIGRANRTAERTK